MVSGTGRQWSWGVRLHSMARESPAAATHSLLPRWNATEAVVPLLARLTPDWTQHQEVDGSRQELEQHILV
jgi:hypothetical protein